MDQLLISVVRPKNNSNKNILYCRLDHELGFNIIENWTCGSVWLAMIVD